MSRDSNGNAVVNRQRAVSGQTVLAEQVNVPFDDIQAMLNLVFWRDGLAPMTGNLNMNGFKIVGMGEATSGTDPVSLDQLNAVKTPTGTIGKFRLTSPPSGWVVEDGRTIGSASSGATNRANADTEALFSALWSNFNNTMLPIQDSTGAASTRGGSASSDFAANKRLPLFDARTRFERGADLGLGYDATITVGAVQADDIKSHAHAVTDPGHTHGISFNQDVTGGGTAERIRPPPGTGTYQTQSSTTGIIIQNTGGTETRPRSIAHLPCIKL